MDKKKNKVETDDDRVVANMNIDGMPWSAKGSPMYDQAGKGAPELTKKEKRLFTRSAVLAGLLVGAIFIIILFLFILFSINVWFR